MTVKPAKALWDEWAIRAELRRRGFTFNKLAAESGFNARSLSAALSKPSTNVNRFIAEKLDTPLHVLWPDWFYSDGELIPLKHRRKLSRARRASASHESRAA